MAVLPFIGPAIDLVSGIMERVLPEKMSEKDAAELQQVLTLEMLKADWGNVSDQLKINLEEAKSEKWWKAGWRPYIGWVCGTAFAYHFVLQPFLVFFVVTFKWAAPPLPTLDMASLMTILGGLLGLGGLRSWEKTKGVA